MGEKPRENAGKKVRATFVVCRFPRIPLASRHLSQIKEESCVQVCVAVKHERDRRRKKTDSSPIFQES